MKKVLSLILAVIMMFSAFTVGFMAFAAEDESAAEETTSAETPIVDDEKTKEIADAAFKFFLGMTYDEFMALDGDAQWEAIKDMDMGKVMFLVKSARAALKLIKLAVKFINILDKLGIIDVSEYKQMIVDFIVDTIKGVVVPEEVPTTEQQPVIA